MIHDGCLEGMTLAVSKLKEAVGTIKDVYRTFPDLIDQEHDAIRASDLDQCEDIAQKKLHLGNQIDGAFTELKHTVRQLVEAYGTATGGKIESIDTLSEVFPLIEEALVRFREEGQNTTVLAHLLDGLKVELEAFLLIKQSTYKKVQVNKQVLARLLANRQENYRFWQEVAADAMASYDAGGKQKAKQRGSTLNIKA